MGLGVRTATGVFRPDTLVFYRSLIQMMILLPWLKSYLSGGEPFAKRFRIHLVRGFFGMFAIFFFYLALQHNPLALVNLLTMTQVFWTALLSWIFLKEEVSPKQLAAATLTCVGLGLSLIDPGHTSTWELNLAGILAALLCAIFSAIALTTVRSMRKRLGAREIVFFFGLSGVLMSFPVFLLRPQFPVGFEQWRLILWIGFAGGIAQILMTAGYKYTKTMIGTLALSVQLPVNLVLGYYFLQESPPAYFLFGAAIAILGIFGLVAQTRHQVGEEQRQGR